VYSQPSRNVQTTLSRVWHLVKGGSVSAIHPPTEDLKFLLEGAPILATPFRKGREGDNTVTCDDLKKFHQQLNYTNTAITTIATQHNHVANRVEETKRQIPIPSNTLENSTYANSISKPFFKVEVSLKRIKKPLLPHSRILHFSSKFQTKSKPSTFSRHPHPV